MFMKTLKVKIANMHCASCGKIITMDLQEMEGIQSVIINDQDKTGEIVFDENKVNEEKILQTISGSDYQATIL